jgi:hypothetical protein
MIRLNQGLQVQILHLLVQNSSKLFQSIYKYPLHTLNQSLQVQI